MKFIARCAARANVPVRPCRLWAEGGRIISAPTVAGAVIASAWPRVKKVFNPFVYHNVMNSRRQVMVIVTLSGGLPYPPSIYAVGDGTPTLQNSCGYKNNPDTFIPGCVITIPITHIHCTKPGLSQQFTHHIHRIRPLMMHLYKGLVVT